jgi:hypothetical protein
MGNERRPTCAAIEYEMTRLVSAPDLAALRLVDTRARAAEVERRGVIRLTGAGDRTLVGFTSAAQARPHGDGDAVGDASVPDEAVYRRHVEGRLKCPLPPREMRLRIYAAISAALQSPGAEASDVPLVDLSYEAAERLARITP